MTQLTALPWLAEIDSRVRNSPSLSLFLDFDGTLAPIVERPDDARLDEHMRSLLTGLSERDDLVMAFVSGRALGDLRRRIGVERAVYAGNHGLEISGMGLKLVEPFSAERQGLLARFCHILSDSLSGIPGVEVENKGLTATVHYRRAAPADHSEIAEIVHDVMTPAGSPFGVSAGNMVWEIVPKTSWHKGAAVCWINSRLAANGTVSIYIGDDRTDEAAFQRLTGEITICVGARQRSSAHYGVASIEGVRVFLSWLTEVRQTSLVSNK